ncbi:MAG: gamma-glutamyl-gamma-aminobutyrate hydrolase family protein [Desulfobulbales bacterium]|nr:gamma-glutamyl-gamma-aminobutyrate hydrolase family protein [Desulfobulbales bacterium]
MKILAINSAPYTEEFVEPIIQCLAEAGVKSETVGYRNIPSNLEPYAGIIISASPKGNDIVASHIPYFHWIKKCSIPVLGICHGHQVMGVVHGADLIMHEQSEDGECLVIIEKDTSLFVGLGMNFKVVQHHDYYITLPDDFKLLASSSRCRVQAMVHNSKPLYSVQFHAEKKPQIIKNFIKMIFPHIMK